MELIFLDYLKQKNKIGMFSLVCLLMTVTLTFSNDANAVDNPDSPDLISAFEVKEKPLLIAAENPQNGYRENLIAYTNYLDFLDKELNSIYQMLREKLPSDRQQNLKDSQISWLKYRDLEFEFIENNWEKGDFGISSSVTRGQFKANIVRNRVLVLMNYTRAY